MNAVLPKEVGDWGLAGLVLMLVSVGYLVITAGEKPREGASRLAYTLATIGFILGAAILALVAFSAFAPDLGAKTTEQSLPSAIIRINRFPDGDARIDWSYDPALADGSSRGGPICLYKFDPVNRRETWLGSCDAVGVLRLEYAGVDQNYAAVTGHLIYLRNGHGYRYATEAIPHLFYYFPRMEGVE